LVIDQDKIGEREIRMVIENTKYPNRCISPIVMDSLEADIGEWHDDHPLNKRETILGEYDKLFNVRQEGE
jgi:hypothetical protein